MKYNDFKIGEVFSFRKKIADLDGNAFAELTGDFNPIHSDNEFAKKSGFEKKIVHGMFAGSLFSTLIGMYCPGKHSLYLSQTLNFKKPIFYGDELTIQGEILSKNDSIKMITLKTEILKEGKKVITGEAKVKVMNDE
ncbi:MAG: MaoC family dehydratase [bacterium]